MPVGALADAAGVVDFRPIDGYVVGGLEEASRAGPAAAGHP
jgi:hypothetical protein